ncbi:hypothetical protein GCM10010267_46000 [Streptomyces griseorubens]|nr:hypothetical protein GCM10010267_46000 [Streptomyces griseorubens]
MPGRPGRPDRPGSPGRPSTPGGHTGLASGRRPASTDQAAHEPPASGDRQPKHNRRDARPRPSPAGRARTGRPRTGVRLTGRARPQQAADHRLAETRTKPKRDRARQ